MVLLLGPRQCGKTTLAREFAAARGAEYFETSWAAHSAMRQLPPWFENLGKRQVKLPKAYLRDTGLLHSLLGIASFAALESHPKLVRRGRASRWKKCCG